MLSKRRNKPAATKFFARALEANGLPHKIVIDRSGANTAAINAVNRILKSFGCRVPIEMVRIKYLDNMVEWLSKTTERSRSRFGRCWGPSPSSLLQPRSRGRGREHDPQRSDDARPLPLCPVRGAGSLAEEDQNPFSDRRR